MRTNTESSKQTWSTTHSWQNNPGGNSSGGAASGSASSSQPAPGATALHTPAGRRPELAPKRSAGPTPVNKKRGTASLTPGTAEGEPTPKKAVQGSTKTPNSTAMALKLKASYNTTMGAANQVLQNIEEDDSWAEFKGLAEEKLRTLIQENKDLAQSDGFFKRFVLDINGQLKKQLDKSEWEKGCSLFNRTLEGPLCKLITLTKKLTQQYQTGIDVENRQL